MAGAMAAGRRPTMADVARTAGVSPMTVSYSYGQPQRVSAAAARKVRRAAAELGYPGPHPGARSLRRGRNNAIGVVLGEHLTYAFTDPQAARFLAGVAEVCGQYAVGLTLVPVTGAAEDSQRVSQAAVDGFVVWTTTDDDPVLHAVHDAGLPAALHGSPSSTSPPRPGLIGVGIDDVAAAEAIGTLAWAGAEHPAVISLPLDRRRQAGLVAAPDPAAAGFPVTRHRLAGLRRTWLGAGGDWAQVRVRTCSTNTAADGAAAMSDLLDVGEVDAVVAMSDELALGALGVLSERGAVVPRQVAVTGWDDTPGAAAAGLSTVRQDLREQGAWCARIALDLADPDADVPEPEWQVVARDTTRQPGAGLST